jgi:hypothetical protein
MVIEGLQAWELIAGKEKRKMLRMLAPKDDRMASIYSKMAKARELHKNVSQMQSVRRHYHDKSSILT